MFFDENINKNSYRTVKDTYELHTQHTASQNICIQTSLQNTYIQTKKHLHINFTA